MKDILQEVLKDIVPDEEEKRAVLSNINRFLGKINSLIGDARAVLGGSMAKGTWLKGVYDADIFVQFPYKKYASKTEQLSDILEQRIKKHFPRISRLHGSRDYFQIQQKGITYEMIPILKIANANQAKNITDISPLHAKWVKKRTKDIDQIRLVKAFCKAQAVYGAESYIRGFSGYVVEILAIYYGSFAKLVREAAKWKPKTMIDPMRYHKNIMFELNQSKLVSPLVLIDPVQAGRNTAASLSLENYQKFVNSCQAFLKNPSMEFFVKRELTKYSLQKMAGKNMLLFISVAATPGKEDVVGGKLLKVFNFFASKLEQHDFRVLDKSWEYDKKTSAILWFIVHPKELPLEQHWLGPPLRSKVNVEAFKKKYKKTYVKGKRIFAIIKRKYTEPEELIRQEAKDIYLKDKVRSIKLQ